MFLDFFGANVNCKSQHVLVLTLCLNVTDTFDKWLANVQIVGVNTHKQ